MHDLRDFTTDRHRVVDDVPYGGGPGMVLKPEPLFRALDAIEAERGAAVGRGDDVAAGRPVHAGRQAQRLSRTAHLVLAVRAIRRRRRAGARRGSTEELSIGDYVLSGGELPALVIVDAVARLVPGVVGDEQSVVEDSFSRGLLDFPHYTRPAEMAQAAGESRRRERIEGAGRAAVGQPRRDPALAEAGSAERGRWSGGRTCWTGATLGRRRAGRSCASLKEQEHERD